MILYDFQCRECQHNFEVFTEIMSTGSLTECQNCGKLSASRCFSGSFSVQGCPTPKFHRKD